MMTYKNISLKSGVFALACAIIFVSIFGYFFGPRPGDAGYGPDNFRFEHFNGSTGLAEDGKTRIDDVLKSFIPPGTDKKQVDKILVQSGKATITKNFDHNYSYMRHRGFANLSGWVVNVEFDKSMKTDSLRLPGGKIY